MKPHRLAMIGARGHHGIVLRELNGLANVELVAVAAGGDSADPLLQWSQSNERQPEVFDDYRAMLDRAEPDVVVVCGPFEQHAEMSIAAITRGIHVYVEKPAAIDRPQLDQLRDAHLRHPDVHLAAMMQSRYDAGFYTAWKLVSGGAIGDVRLIDARKSYRLGKRPAFYARRETYGGTIPWVGSHAIDWVHWFAAAPLKR